MIRNLFVLMLLVNVLVCPIRCGHCAEQGSGATAQASRCHCCDESRDEAISGFNWDAGSRCSAHSRGPEQSGSCGCLDCICDGAVIPEDTLTISALPLTVGRAGQGAVGVDAGRQRKADRVDPGTFFLRPYGVAAQIAYQSWLI